MCSCRPSCCQVADILALVSSTCCNSEVALFAPIAVPAKGQLKFMAPRELQGITIISRAYLL